MSDRQKVVQHLRGRPWAQTVTGRAVPLVEAQPSDIHWPDVVYGLAYLNRYAGQAGFYSVAQHTVHCLNELPENVRPYWLLHDAHEFVLSDLSRPMQRAMEWEGARSYSSNGFVVAGAIRAVKNGMDYAIYSAAGLEWPLPVEIQNAIHEADSRMLMTEQRDLLGCEAVPLDVDAESFGTKIAQKWAPSKAYYEFGLALNDLVGVGLPTLYDLECDIERLKKT